jgi:xanthine/uracil/vitamin C permease (AzgA family)
MNRFFHYKERGGTLGGEIAAGLGMFFLATCGIFINMQLIAKLLIFADYTSSNANQVAYNGNMYALTWFVSMLIACIGSLLIGLIAHLPLVQTGGLSLSTVLVSMIGLETGLNYYNLLFVCFISSIVYTVLVAVPGIREFVFKALPNPVRKALPAASGLFMAWIAIQLTSIVSLAGSKISIYGAGENLENVNDSVYLFGVIPVSSYSFGTDQYHPLLLISGIAVFVTVILFLIFRQRTKKPFLFSLLGGTVFFLVVYAFKVCFDLTTMKASLDSLWGRLWMVGSEDAMQTHISTIIKNIQFGQIFSTGMDFTAYTEAGGSVVKLFAVGILTFLFLNMYESEASLSVVAEDVFENEEEAKKHTKLARICNAATNILAPVLGASPVEISKASVAGSRDGSKSSLPSLIAAIGFLISIFVWVVPFIFGTNYSYNITFNLYGHNGTVLQLLSETGFVVADIVMVLVGVTMAVKSLQKDWKKSAETEPFVMTVAGTLLFSNLACGVALGTITYVITELTRKKEEGEEGNVITRIGIPCMVWAVVSLILLVMTIL